MRRVRVSSPRVSRGASPHQRDAKDMVAVRIGRGERLVSTVPISVQQYKRVVLYEELAWPRTNDFGDNCGVRIVLYTYPIHADEVTRNLAAVHTISDVDKNGSSSDETCCYCSIIFRVDVFAIILYFNQRLTPTPGPNEEDAAEHFISRCF